MCVCASPFSTSCLQRLAHSEAAWRSSSLCGRARADSSSGRYTAGSHRPRASPPACSCPPDRGRHVSVTKHTPASRETHTGERYIPPRSCRWRRLPESRVKSDMAETQQQDEVHKDSVSNKRCSFDSSKYIKCLPVSSKILGRQLFSTLIINQYFRMISEDHVTLKTGVMITGTCSMATFCLLFNTGRVL